MPARLQVGSTVAGYRIDALIARGGMGVVYRATHLGLERPVALKVIARELADRGGFRERFLRESRLAARLDHPAVVPIFDSREVDGELLVAMRLVAGGDLRRLIDRDGPLPSERATALLGQVADALDAAHAAGIVHRDVKPHNVLVEGDRAFLSDFGLAKALDESGAASGTSVVGTAEYMSPEQWRGGSVGPAADVYSLGCVLFEAVTGVPPYARRESDTEPEIPAGLEDVIERAVAKDPGDRFHSAGALIAAARQRQGSELRPTKVLSAEWEEARTGELGSGGGARPRIGSGRARTGRRRRRLFGLALGGAALLAAVVVAAILLLGGGDSTKVYEPLAVGPPPLRLAAAGPKVWIVSESGGSLTEIDAAEPGFPVHRREAHLGGKLAGVAVGGGSVWITDSASGRLLRLDPESGRLRERIEVGGRPGAVVYGGNRVWVADERGAGVTAVNAAGGRVFRRHIAPHASPLRLAAGAGGVWVANASAGTVRRIDLGTATPSVTIPAGRGLGGITVARGFVWVADSRSGTVAKIDPAIRAVVDTIEVDGKPGGIDAGTDVLWVASADENAVTRIDLGSDETEGSPLAVGPEPGAVGVGRDSVWVANNGDGTVTRIEP
ncbi:MAG TPA: serine/threonine-protein kinase [Solirubrobacterales bacterium]|nr:serine/threonine-protein kinase [Solirubrobacterales bacterium]